MQNPAQQQPYERLPFPLISRDIFNPGDKRDVTARNGADDPPFTPERFIVLNPADWVVHRVTIGDHAVISTQQPGRMFAPNAPIKPPLDWGDIQPGQVVTVTAEYVGLLGALPFQASIWGVRAMRR